MNPVDHPHGGGVAKVELQVVDIQLHLGECQQRVKEQEQIKEQTS